MSWEEAGQAFRFATATLRGQNRRFAKHISRAVPMKPILLGYFPKELVPLPDWMVRIEIKEIGSVSQCLSAGPEGWMEAWQHNEWGYFRDPETAWGLVPTAEQHRYRLHAYALDPSEFGDGEEQSMVVPELDVLALGGEFRCVGWDVVSRSAGQSFECSPLSCNLLAEEFETNAYCLFEDFSDARDLALAAHSLRCEPGPYHIVEVWIRDA